MSLVKVEAYIKAQRQWLVLIYVAVMVTLVLTVLVLTGP